MTWWCLTDACVAVVPAAHVCAAVKGLRQNTPQPDQVGLQQLRLFSYPCKAEVMVTCPDVLVEEKQERKTTPHTCPFSQGSILAGTSSHTQPVPMPTCTERNYHTLCLGG